VTADDHKLKATMESMPPPIASTTAAADPPVLFPAAVANVAAAAVAAAAAAAQAHAQPQQPIMPLELADSRQLLKLAAMPLIRFSKGQMIDELCLRGARMPNGSLANSKSQFRDKKIGTASMYQPL
jgi:hypothetical protein